MNWQALIDVIALVLIIEGLLPFISPEKYKAYLFQILHRKNQELRITAFIIIAIGIIMLLLS